MRVLFDHGVPRPLRDCIQEHGIATTKEQGWETYKNGDLLTEAERAGFKTFVTTDKNLGYQQNMSGRQIAILVIGNAQWPLLKLHTQKVQQALDEISVGGFKIFDI